MIRNTNLREPGSGMLLGTCTRIAARMKLPPLAVRIAAVVALCWAFKLTVAAYCLGAFLFRQDRR